MATRKRSKQPNKLTVASIDHLKGMSGKGIYILELYSRKVYVGSSHNVYARICKHIQGLGSVATQTYCPVRVHGIWTVPQGTDMRQAERQLTNWMKAHNSRKYPVVGDPIDLRYGESYTECPVLNHLYGSKYMRVGPPRTGKPMVSPFTPAAVKARKARERYMARGLWD